MMSHIIFLIENIISNHYFTMQRVPMSHILTQLFEFFSEDEIISEEKLPHLLKNDIRDYGNQNYQNQRIIGQNSFKMFFQFSRFIFSLGAFN